MIIRGDEIIIFDFLNKKYTLYNSTLNNLDGIIKGHYNRKTKEFIFSRQIDGKIDFHTISESQFLIGEKKLFSTHFIATFFRFSFHIYRITFQKKETIQFQKSHAKYFKNRVFIK